MRPGTLQAQFSKKKNKLMGNFEHSFIAFDKIFVYN